MNEQAEDPSRAESAATEASSFSSSLGPHASAPSTAEGTLGADGAASSQPDGDADSATAQLGKLVSDASSRLASLTSERPEVVIGAAFLGGLLIATILKRLAR